MDTQLSDNVKGTWVQTERAAHEKWAQLIVKSPKAAALLHLLVANMSGKNAVVVSQQVLAELMGVHRNTVKNALKVLTDQNWIEAVRVGSERGGVNAYVVNRRVGWADRRENQRYAAFDAQIIVSRDEQESKALENSEPLRQLPQFGELQVPAGVGMEPPAQALLEGVDCDLPATGGPSESLSNGQ